jgi:hypothetical protein
MNGKRLFTALTVAAALTLFSSFAFGQVAPSGVSWKDVAVASSSQVDNVSVQVSTLEFIIDTEMSNPTPCEQKAILYKAAILDLQEAKVHIDKAYANCQALAITRFDLNGRKLVIFVFSELSRATEAFNKALLEYYDAHFVIC